MTVACIYWLKLLKNLYQSTARVATSLSLALRSVCSSGTYRCTCPARESLAVAVVVVVVVAAAAAVIIIIIIIIIIYIYNRK
jgi:hypothetical protein